MPVHAQVIIIIDRDYSSQRISMSGPSIRIHQIHRIFIAVHIGAGSVVLLTHRVQGGPAAEGRAVVPCAKVQILLYLVAVVFLSYKKYLRATLVRPSLPEYILPKSKPVRKRSHLNMVY